MRFGGLFLILLLVLSPVAFAHHVPNSIQKEVMNLPKEDFTEQESSWTRDRGAASCYDKDKKKNIAADYRTMDEFKACVVEYMDHDQNKGRDLKTAYFFWTDMMVRYARSIVGRGGSVGSSISNQMTESSNAQPVHPAPVDNPTPVL